MAFMSDSPRNRFASMRKESSADDDISLAKERKSSLVPLTRSPFEKTEEELAEEKRQAVEEHHPDELRVFVTEVPWSDLLLEIAMTTAFASLTDGTPVLEASAVTSYLCFFALVWWIWASQVAYNVRFRTVDWLHRIFVFLQLLVFSALAAFTNNFDIFNGLAPDHDATVVAQLQLLDGFAGSDIAAAQYRDNRLPTLNARGISVVMGLSRLLLLFQYVIALYHAPSAILRASALPGTPGSVDSHKRTHTHRHLRSFYVHIGTLAFSALSYFVAYAAIGKDPSTADQAIKLALWYLPLFFEVAAHFYAMQQPGRVRYGPEAVYARTATVFIIILGGGLDKITNGFQYIVGNVSLGKGGFGLILSAAIIFITQFTLYFTMTESGKELTNRKILSWFFCHYFYLSALIVMLQGVAALLQFGTIADAINTPVQLVHDLSRTLHQTNLTAYLNATDYPDLQHSLNKTGIAIDSVIEYVNSAIDMGLNETIPETPYNAVFQYGVVVLSVTLQNFKAYPDQDSVLYSRISLFLDSMPDNTTLINATGFQDIIQEVFVSNATPALWFYGAAGSTFVTLVFLSLIKQWPRDKYEWGQICSRFFLGILVILLCVLDVNAEAAVIDEQWKIGGSGIWRLAAHSWVLPPLAILLAAEQTVEYILLYLAGRSYGVPHYLAGITRGYANGDQAVQQRVSMTPSAYERPYDPYTVYDNSTRGKGYGVTSDEKEKLQATAQLEYGGGISSITHPYSHPYSYSQEPDTTIPLMRRG